MRLTRGWRFGELYLGTEGRCPSLKDRGSTRSLDDEGVADELMGGGQVAVVGPVSRG